MSRPEVSASAGNIARLIAEATSLHQQGHLAEAEGLLQAALREDAGNFDALHRIGTIRVEEGRHEEAVEYLNRALQRSPDSANAHYNLGIALAALGRPDEAMASYGKAIALEPDNAEAHTNLGNLLAAARLSDAAIASYRRALAIRPDLTEAKHNLIRTLLRSGRRAEVDEGYRQWLLRVPGDPEVRYLYAVFSGKAIAPRVPDVYVERVFDGYAATFDADLHRLGYQSPKLVLDALASAGGPPRGRLDTLDAGCGTGLCGPLLKPHARRLTGVDLSSSMLEQAQATGVYDALDKAELTTYLGSHPEAFDLVVSADVLCYFGPLEPLLAAAHAALRPGGMLIATVDRAFDHEAREGFRINPHGRYSHSLTYLRRILPVAGFGVLAIEPAILRKQSGRPVAGFVLTCEKVVCMDIRARAWIRLRAMEMSIRGILRRRRRRRS